MPPAFIVILCVIVAAVAAGMAYSCLLAFACINLKADQTLVGTAMNMLGTAGATVLVKAMNTAANPNDVSSTISYIATKKNFIIQFDGFQFNWFMVIAVIALAISWLVLYKTKFGLRLQACGEHP